MTEISAQMVKELRDKTGAGMMDCKKALGKSGGDMEVAIEELRKAGVVKAAKKAGRSATEGRVFCVIRDGAAVVVEMLCETDFVAKTEEFTALGTAVAERAMDAGDVDADISEAVAAAESGNLTTLIGKIGENMQIRRVIRWKSAGSLDSYLHMGGRIGVLIDVEGDADEELLHDICLHIAAFNPQFTTPDTIPADVIEKEKEIAAAQVEGKPANIVEKIVLGKVAKWYTESCLSNQPWIKDDKTCLAKLAPKVAVKRFIRWQVGEEL